MDRTKIIEEMIATRTGRPPNKLLKIIAHLMSFPSRDVTVRDVSTSLGLGATTVNDAFKKLEKIGYLDKRTIQKEEYKEERRIKTGKQMLIFTGCHIFTNLTRNSTMILMAVANEFRKKPTRNMLMPQRNMKIAE